VGKAGGGSHLEPVTGPQSRPTVDGGETAHWASALQSPWPAQSQVVIVAPARPRLGVLTDLAPLTPLSPGLAPAPPIAMLVLGLLSIVALVVILAILVAHLLH
jgi:hypothetical protein